MTHAVIEVSDLRRRYGGADGFEAVRGVSFDVRRGELFALLGTNGAGKTSTLEVLEGIVPPSGGAVRVLGRDPYADRSQVRPRIGIMLQEGGFPSDLTVAETGRMWAGVRSPGRPVGEALELAGLDHRKTAPIRALSGGERRRLDLALAVIGAPEVLFLDEPTTGLDPESRRNTWLLMRNLLEDGATIVLTTHYLEEAEALADRLAIMHGGRIVTAGTAAEIAASQPARISFQLPDVRARDELPVLSGRVQVDGTQVTVHTETLQHALTELLAWANPKGLELRRLDARSASLEEAFMAVAAGDHLAGLTGEVVA